VRALPKLRVLVIGLLKSLSSIVYIGMLLLLLFYLYAVVGVSLFGQADPVFMGTLHIALLTLFRAATLEDWTDLMYTHQIGCDEYGYSGFDSECVAPQAFGGVAVAYWVSFIVMSSMIILNL
jgi:voltage-gated sodium channel